MTKTLIRRGHLIDPANGQDFIGDLLIEDGVIADLAANLPPMEDCRQIEADGLIVAPGLVDIHCHLREPGFPRKETIKTGTAAAVAGGFTSVLPMPNTQPAADNSTVIRYILDQAGAAGLAKVYPIGAISKGLAGAELAEMGEMIAAGAVAFSDDGRPVMNSRLMRLALEYSLIFDVPLVAHEEDLLLADEGDMHEGFYSTVLGLRGIPAAAEEAMIARDILLARQTGARLHIAHVSTAEGVELIRRGKEQGLSLTAEVTPHHLTLTHAAVSNYDTNTKVNPPLREQEDVEALIQGLKEGIIDCIATDHAPHTWEDKDVEFSYAAMGISGLETALPLLWTELVETGHLTARELIAKMSAAPAAVMRLPGGSLSPGAPADIVLIDPQRERVVDRDRFLSLGKNTPYDGRALRGWPQMTLVDGAICYEDGIIKHKGER